MLVELGLVEQRYQAVREVLDHGATVVDVARRNGVARQTVHEWLRRYATQGLAGLADHSSSPPAVPIRWIRSVVEARIVELGRQHPGWEPRTIGYRLAREGTDPLPGRSSIYRCLIRRGLITPEARRRRRSDYKRWERSHAMELWQMNVVGGVCLADGTEAKISPASMTTPGSVCRPWWWPGTRPGRPEWGLAIDLIGSEPMRDAMAYPTCLRVRGTGPPMGSRPGRPPRYRLVIARNRRC